MRRIFPAGPGSPQGPTEPTATTENVAKMKRSMLGVLFGAVCFLAGLSLKPLVTAWAQGKIQAEEDAKASPRAVPVDGARVDDGGA